MPTRSGSGRKAAARRCMPCMKRKRKKEPRKTRNTRKGEKRTRTRQKISLGKMRASERRKRLARQSLRQGVGRHRRVRQGGGGHYWRRGRWAAVGMGEAGHPLAETRPPERFTGRWQDEERPVDQPEEEDDRMVAVTGEPETEAER